MTSRIADAILMLPVLSRPRRRRLRKPIALPAGARNAPQRRPARAPQMLTLSARRVERRNLPEVVVPYLRMSGRWLEEHGFVIGAGVRVVVEQGRIVLVSDVATHR
jgi:hypothetical protein